MNIQKKKYLLIGILLSICSISFSGYVAAAHYWPGGGGGDNQSRKYGYIIWDSGVVTQDTIDYYKSILIAKDYLAADYDAQDITDRLLDIDDQEDDNDILFFYFVGHGLFNLNGNMQSNFQYYDSMYLSSSGLRVYFDRFEAKSIGVLMSSCHSGEFVDQFEDDDRTLFMTACDEVHGAAIWESSFPGRCVFASYFWNNVNNGDDAITAFNNAKALNAEEPYWIRGINIITWYNQYPQITPAGPNFF